jgi:hypothetical protein
MKAKGEEESPLLESQVQSQGLIDLQHDRTGNQTNRLAQTFDRC